jgi:hypothetical protein
MQMTKSEQDHSGDAGSGDPAGARDIKDLFTHTSRYVKGLKALNLKKRIERAIAKHEGGCNVK